MNNRVCELAERLCVRKVQCEGAEHDRVNDIACEVRRFCASRRGSARGSAWLSE